MTNVATRLKALEEGYEDLVAGLYRAALGQGSIMNKNIRPKSVTSGLIDTGAVTADKIDSGAVTADKIDVAELAAVAASTGDLSVSGTLTIGPGGSIEDGDGSVWDQTGLNLQASNDPNTPGDVIVFSRSGNTPVITIASGISSTIAYAQMVAQSTDATRMGLADVNCGTTDASATALVGAISSSGTDTYVIAHGDGRVRIKATEVSITSLPTSNPGGSGILWNDAGTVKIT